MEKNLKICNFTRFPFIIEEPSTPRPFLYFFCYMMMKCEREKAMAPGSGKTNRCGRIHASRNDCTIVFVSDISSTTGTTSETGTMYPSGAPEFLLGC